MVNPKRPRRGPPRKLTPRRVYPFTQQFTDHTGNDYTVVHVDTSHHVTMPRLGIQIYCLGDPSTSPVGLAQGLLMSDALQALGRTARCDVYTGFGTIDACINHHRREKVFRYDATQRMRREAVAGLSEEDAHERLVDEIRGRQPLPHIVPTWCSSAEFWSEGEAGGRYRSWILVIPEDRTSWEDVVNKGLVHVQFDLDVTQEMLVLIHDCDPEDDMVLEGEVDGYVDIEKTTYDKYTAVWTRLLCVRPQPPSSFPNFLWEAGSQTCNEAIEEWQTPNSDGHLTDAMYDAKRIFRDCTYRDADCDDCTAGDEHAGCERELDEHFVDEDGQCVACRRAREYRRRSKRIAARAR